MNDQLQPEEAKTPPPNVTERSGVYNKINGTRKFMLAAFGSLVSVGLCYFGHITGSEWVEVQALILALYGGANVMDKKFGGNG